MKLLKIYRAYTYTSLCLVILIGFLSNYFLFKHSNHRSADEVIQEYRKDIENYAEEYGTLRPLMAVNSKFGTIYPADPSSDLSLLDEKIHDTLAYDPYQNETVIFRKLVFGIQTDVDKYIVRLMLPTIDQDELIGTVAISMILFFLLFILFTTIIDFSFTRHIFHPFNKILDTIKNYNLEKKTNIDLGETDIDEFQELNQILTEMIEQINDRYFEMKEFLEYTSHELQTPLSVIQLKLELLNQMTSENQEMLNCTASIQKSLQRAIRFNRSILFIAKIRNNQYSEQVSIDLNKLFDNYIQQYDEMLSMRHLKVSFESRGIFQLQIHPLLAEHLAQNIMTNAIKHNYDDGEIQFHSTTHQFVVSNTFDGTIPKGDLFEKYNHSIDKKDSNGLGLAIVKTICIKNDIDIHYQIEDHIFTITLTKKDRVQ